MRHPLRLLQALTVFSAGLYALFVFGGNLMDYNSNYEFVHHVLSMDTTFEGNALMWRAIESEVVHHIAYVGIITAEGLFAALGLIGGVKLFLNRNADAVAYNRARTWGYAAFGVGFLIWFVGFVVIGSEWFAMWQSEIWNGQAVAMNLTTIWAAFAVLLAMNEPAEVSAAADGQTASSGKRTTQ